MLKYLKIDNFKIIKTAEIHWHRGLTVITGETGSGKSIILYALSLISGARNNNANDELNSTIKATIETKEEVKEINRFVSQNKILINNKQVNQKNAEKK